MKKYLSAFLLSLSLLCTVSFAQASVYDNRDPRSPYELQPRTSDIYSSGSNSSYYGQISEETGRPKTVYVNPYTRDDGTSVQGHYRSAPRR